MITQEYLENIQDGKVRVIPSVFAESAYLLQGKPFRFAGRSYLRTIYDTDIFEGMIKSGRQVEKSTTLSIKMGNDVLLKPFCRDLFVAPQNEQVKTFSRERLSKLFRYSQSDIVRKHYMSTDLMDNVFMKEFKNGSTLWLRHCFEDGDNIRGLSIDNLYMDEIQDINVDAIPVIKETQSHSESPIVWYTGTPKTFSNTIEQLWQTSSQAEWVVKCHHCGTYQVLGLANMTPKYLQCRKCKLELNFEDTSGGFWKEKYPDRIFKGFHISQLMIPSSRKPYSVNEMWTPQNDGIYQKYEKYSTAKFYNEVLGLSYENADKPITDQMLDDLLRNEDSFLDELKPPFSLQHVYMGVDWGTGERSYTVVTIFAENPETSKYQMLYCKRFETGEEGNVEYQLRYIGYLMGKFKVKLAAVDWGFGFAQIQKLREVFGNRIVPIYYSHNQTKKVFWDNDKLMYKVRRTDIIQDYIMEMIHARGAAWPGAERVALKFMRDHHLTEQVEYRPSANGRSEEMIFTHPMTSPDDGLHSCVYAYLARILDRENLHGFRKFQSNNIVFHSVQTR